LANGCEAHANARRRAPALSLAEAGAARLRAIQTARLTLVPATAILVRAELANREEFARLLLAAVPADWPPEGLAEALSWFLVRLEAAPEHAGWYGWYAVVSGEDPAGRTLVGSGGFHGPPDGGTVELGFSVLSRFWGCGYATEMARGLVRWAISHAEVVRIVARTERDNAASMRVLRRAGFRPCGSADERGAMRFERQAVPRAESRGGGAAHPPAARPSFSRSAASTDLGTKEETSPP